MDKETKVFAARVIASALFAVYAGAILGMLGVVLWIL